MNNLFADKYSFKTHEYKTLANKVSILNPSGILEIKKHQSRIDLNCMSDILKVLEPISKQALEKILQESA